VPTSQYPPDLLTFTPSSHPVDSSGLVELNGDILRSFYENGHEGLLKIIWYQALPAIWQNYV
jgi:hypothetical protein